MKADLKTRFCRLVHIHGVDDGYPDRRLIYRSTSHWSFNRYFVFISRVLILIFMWYDLHNVTDVAAQFPLDKWPGFLEMLGRSLAGLLVLALIPIAIFDSEDRVVFLKAILG